MRRKAMVLLLAVFVVSLISAGVARSHPQQPRSFGVVIQGTDYDSQKDQTTFHLLNVSSKTVNAWFLSLQTKLPDGTLTPAGGEFGIELDSGPGVDPGPMEDLVRPGDVIAAVSLVMYSDGTFEGNAGLQKSIVDTRKGRIAAQQKIIELINAALADPNEQHPTAKVIAQLKAELVSKKTSLGYQSELESALQNITNAYKSPRMSEPGWEADRLEGLVKHHQDRAVALKEVLK
jgi:hypothetical protein